MLLQLKLWLCIPTTNCTEYSSISQMTWWMNRVQIFCTVHHTPWYNLQRVHFSCKKSCNSQAICAKIRWMLCYMNNTATTCQLSILRCSHKTAHIPSSYRMLSFKIESNCSSGSCWTLTTWSSSIRNPWLSTRPDHLLCFGKAVIQMHQQHY